ncbi:MAG: mannonate dehydratase [Bacteroidales bacterium]|nr:mannonate dehydratase [Bacteroidales bacterium]
MEKTWRWFGNKDRITLQMLRQIGVEGVVSSLYDVPNGEIWTLEAINTHKAQIEAAGLKWSVVESLPVSEAIKYGGQQRNRLIARYKQSLINLGEAGIKTVCYNFMPVIDWVRTDLLRPCEDGAYSLYFDKAKYAYFDTYIVRGESARQDYDKELLARVDALAPMMTDADNAQLIDTIIVKTQGFISGNIKEGDADPVGLFRELLSHYDGVTKQDLRENLRYFLSEIMPVCEEYGINMCIHPDDPPMPVFGLPRIVCDAEDIAWILSAVDNPHNGLTFCAGSLSSGAHNDVLEMAERFASRIRFVHLRSCEVLPGGDFIEAPHTGGRADLVALVQIFEQLEEKLPMRVDHGRTILSDEQTSDNPGYSFHGRMLALAQVEGIITAVRHQLNK